MSWQDDPEIRRQIERGHARTSLIRGAAIWLPFFVLSALGFLFFAFDEATGGDKGSWFLVLILLGLAVLFGFQGLQPLWDLFTPPTEVRGWVTRRWSRSDSLVVRSHYIRINNKQIFRIDRDVHGDVKEADFLRVEYYPHSATVVEVEKVPPPEGEKPPPGMKPTARG